MDVFSFTVLCLQAPVSQELACRVGGVARQNPGYVRPGGSPGATLPPWRLPFTPLPGIAPVATASRQRAVCIVLGSSFRGVTEGRRPEANATGEVFSGVPSKEQHRGPRRRCAGCRLGSVVGRVQRDSQAQEGCHEGVTEALCSPVGLSPGRPQERRSMTDVRQTAQRLGTASEDAVDAAPRWWEP